MVGNQLNLISLSSIINRLKSHKNYFMNHYDLNLQDGNVDKNVLRALALMYISGSDFDARIALALDKDGNPVKLVTCSASLAISLSNFLSPSLTQTVYASENTQTVESFDKSIISVGDIVVAVATTANENMITEYYDDYVKFPLLSAFGQGGHIFMGQSNSEKSQFHEPFEGIDTLIIISPTKVAVLAEGAEFGL
jgi:hypothetical protein